MDGLGENFIALLGTQAGACQPVPQQEMRRGIGSKCHRLACQIFQAVDSLAADQAIGSPRPVHHVESVRTKALLLKLGIVLCPDVGSGQHDINVVCGQGCGALRPIVDDLEGDLEAQLVINGARSRVQPTVRHQPASTTDPDVDANPHIVRFRSIRGSGRQRFRGVYDSAAGPAGMRAEPLMEVEYSISVQAVADQPQAY